MLSKPHIIGRCHLRTFARIGAAGALAILGLGGLTTFAPSRADAGVLHRIDPAFVRDEVETAGFTFKAESPVLHNPRDPRTAPVFDPAIRGHTDQFVFKFRKPS